MGGSTAPGSRAGPGRAAGTKLNTIRAVRQPHGEGRPPPHRTTLTGIR